jgi:hypothetical protein
MERTRPPILPALWTFLEQLPTIRARLRAWLRELYELDMRYAYAVCAALVAIGLVVNLFLPHGWTVWPAVFVAGMLCMIHEAAERNGQGVPPLHVSKPWCWGRSRSGWPEHFSSA